MQNVSNGSFFLKKPFKVCFEANSQKKSLQIIQQRVLLLVLPFGQRQQKVPRAPGGL